MFSSGAHCIGLWPFWRVAELELVIDLYVAHHNIDPKPFIWTVSTKDSWPR